MEYYNRITPNYLRAIKKSYGRYLLKLELLTENETVVGEIIQPISIDSAGQLNINYQQITRRSCSLALINVDNKYAPNQNSWFWYRRKFKLWYGLSYGEDSWWFTQGVFITNGANGDCHLINIEAVDKGGMLDGTLKYNLLESKIVFEKGSKIAQLVRDTLLLSDGRNVIDPTPPLIDKVFEDAEIEKEITINENAYIGELFKTLAETYGADVFYDTNGRLNFTRLVDGDRVDGYRYMGAQYEFSDEDKVYLISSLNYSYDAVNAVTVYTNITAKSTEENTTIENQTYTAYNTNPRSPINVTAIGVRRMESIEISYIDNLSPKEMRDRCKQYADYNLIKCSLPQLAINFTAVPVPHLDVNKTILITDKTKDIESGTYVVQSITMPLSAGEMNVEATSIDVLPNDTDIERGGDLIG